MYFCLFFYCLIHVSKFKVIIQDKLKVHDDVNIPKIIKNNTFVPHAT